MQYLALHSQSNVIFATIKDTYVEINNKFIFQLQINAKAVRILAKDYLPISLITPFKLKEFKIQQKKCLLKPTQITTS